MRSLQHPRRLLKNFSRNRDLFSCITGSCGGGDVLKLDAQSKMREFRVNMLAVDKGELIVQYLQHSSLQAS